MQPIKFELSDKQFQEINESYPNLGKNSHVGHSAVEIVKYYFKVKYNNNVEFLSGNMGADIEVVRDGVTDKYEIKGTMDTKISWQKLKVSSLACHDALKDGMALIRVTNIGEKTVYLHFLKYGEDFTLVPEHRWAVKKLIK